MTRKDQGKYALKHPPDIKVDDRIAESIRKRLKKGRLSCAAAEKIAVERSVPLVEVGRSADLMEVRITECMLGLFGYFTPDGKKIKPAAAKSVPAAVGKAIAAEIEDGGITCEALWRIGKETGVTRKALGRICEALKLKVKSCQLGAF